MKALDVRAPFAEDRYHLAADQMFARGGLRRILGRMQRDGVIELGLAHTTTGVWLSGGSGDTGRTGWQRGWFARGGSWDGVDGAWQHPPQARSVSIIDAAVESGRCRLESGVSLKPGGQPSPNSSADLVASGDPCWPPQHLAGLPVRGVLAEIAAG